MAGLMQISIYGLCFLAAGMCTFLLLRGYRASGTRLLLWSALCFGFLALNSLVVILDNLVFPASDLQLLRHAASLAAVGTLLFGLIVEIE